MSETAAAQLRRILQLVPAVADGEPHNLEDLAGRVGVDRAVLLQDLVSLSRRYDEPGAFVAGLQIYIDGRQQVEVISNHFLRPMRLTRNELLALELGLAMIARERAPEEQRSIQGARERLQEVLARLPEGVGLDDRRTAAISPPPDMLHLRALREALRTRHKVRLGYLKAGAKTASRRVVCPFAILFTRGKWYLVARCADDDVRIFRIDRVTGVRQLEETFEWPGHFRVEDVVKEGRAFKAADAGTLKLRYSPNVARWIAEREGKELEQDGSLVMEHPLADMDWAVRHVLQYGPDVDVLEPVEVREKACERLQTMIPTGSHD